MKKYSKIKRVGHDQNQGMFADKEDKLIIKEKLDGANFRFTVNEDNEFVFGSRNVEYKIDGEPDYTENVDGRFKDAINYVRHHVAATQLVHEIGHKEFTVFGENMVKHSLDYEYETNPPPQVICFDIYDHKKEEYLSKEIAYEIFDEVGLEPAPIAEELTVDEFRDYHGSEDSYTIPKSEYRDGKGEGVVIINTEMEENNRSGFNTRAKLVTDEFAEKHKKATGANQSKEAVNDHEKLVSKYCTDGRIRKHIEKMRDHGRELGMELMANQDGVDGLPIRVSKDIVEEEYDDIVTSNWTIDFKRFRSLVADRCVYVLRQEVQKL